MVRGLMSDEEWGFFAPFVIETGPRRGRRPRDHRLVLDGVFWIARTGSPWRDLHDHFGKWDTFYGQFRRWTLGGVWDVLLVALNETGQGQDSFQMIDSTTRSAGAGLVLDIDEPLDPGQVLWKRSPVSASLAGGGGLAHGITNLGARSLVGLPC